MAITLVISCFMPWVVIGSKNIVVSGVDATGTSFGKPGYFHFVMTGIFILFMLIPRIWSKRANLLITGFNVAWAFRNFIIISACHMGECPEKKPGIYIALIASLLMLVSSFFPDIKLKEGKENQGKSEQT